MRKGEYYNAAEYYRQGLEKHEFNIELKYKYAEALRGFNDYKNAAELYKQAAVEDATKEYPLATFYYGLMLHYLGRYDAAATQFKKFLNRYKIKGYYMEKAQQEIESCAWAKEHLNDKKELKIIHLPDGINTAYSETNPFETSKDQLLFSALRNVAPAKKKEKFLARFYEADSAGTSSKIVTLTKADDEKNIANGAYCPDREKFYFTQCEPDAEKGGQLRCEIYVRDMSDTAAAPMRLDNNINYPGYTATQPNVGREPDGTEELYYVSDRPGSVGKTDIWMSVINKDGSNRPPVNLGPTINTIDEEFSPFFDSRERKLYFASNWHYGYGGLDIFETSPDAGLWSAPVNLGAAINSPQNDFYFYKSNDRSKNYFASNRKGSLFIKAETCCNDLWMYETGQRIERVDTPVIIAKLDTPAQKKAEVKTDTLPAPKPVFALIDTSPRVFIDKTIKKMKQLLPVTLYFHNDEPECCNLRDTTALNYVSTYQDYWSLLSKYEREYTKGLRSGEQTEAEHEVFTLFTEKVEKGYYDLIQFSAQMLDLLQSGQKLEITIQGYCSPLNYNAYNIKLGYRRIASLRNYFYHYRDGIFMPYINKGNLVLKNESMGEEKAAKTVSDSREDTRNSVYNPAAALERKVEVISVEIK